MVTLIRHSPVAAVPGLCYGRTDVPLAPSFADDAEALRAKLDTVPDVVFASPSTRCVRLAEALGAREVRTDERLRELDFGAWENCRWDDLPRAEVDAWASDFVDVRPPGGETFRELTCRVDEFRQEPLESPAVVITHAGVIRAWLCLVENRPLRDAFDIEVSHGAYFTVPLVRRVVRPAVSNPSHRPARQKTCSRCGTAFLCGHAAGKSKCWCDDMPPVGAIPGARDCLCPSCLRAVIDAWRRENPSR